MPLRSLYNLGVQVPLGCVRRYHPSEWVGTTRTSGQVPLERVGRCHPNEWADIPRSECSVHSVRRVIFVPPEATPPILFHQVFRQGKLEADRKLNYICKTKFYCPLRSERIARPARRVALAVLEVPPPPDPFSSKVFMRVLTLVKTRVGGELV